MFQIEIEPRVLIQIVGIVMSAGAAFFVSKKKYGVATWWALLAIANFIQAGSL